MCVCVSYHVDCCWVFLSQKLLQQEIEQLKYKIDHHPDVTKFAMENLDLRGACRICQLTVYLPRVNRHSDRFSDLHAVGRLGVL